MPVTDCSHFNGDLSSYQLAMKKGRHFNEESKSDFFLLKLFLRTNIMVAFFFNFYNFDWTIEVISFRS